LADLLARPPAGLRDDDIKLQLAFTYQAAGMRVQAQGLNNELYCAHPTSLPVVQQYVWFLSGTNDPTYHEHANRIIRLLPPPMASDRYISFARARLSMRGQDMAATYQRYCDCLQEWNDCSLYWCDLGVFYFRNDQFQDSIVAFQRALYFNPEIIEAWLNLGFVFEFQGDCRSALAIYTSGLRNCANAQILKDRMALFGTPQRLHPATALVEVDERKCFVQIAENIALELLSSPPQIPLSQIASDPAVRSLGPITHTYTSLFAA
jgi:tetratricopeptide (TPR) repeat protein